MKSSAIVTALSFLAATALGAALISGCELSSSTVDDTDGGDPPPNNNDSGTKDSSTTDSSTGDSGSTCDNPKQKEPFAPEACQSCLNTSCCGALQKCFNIPGEGETKTDCNVYSDCINDCNTNPDNNTDEKKVACYADFCDPTAAEGVKTAYEELIDCAVAKCATGCN